MGFVDLMDAAPEGPPADQQAWATGRFPALVETSPFALRTPGDPIPQSGTRLLLGVAPAWNRYDLILLDILQSQWRRVSDRPIVHLVDTDCCTSLPELREYFPGIQSPTTWPLLGIWSDGELVEVTAGDEARRRVLHVLGLDADEFDRALQADARRRATPLVQSTHP